MKLKLGMIGGGNNSFIGPVHRMAAQLDGMIEVVSGAFSSKAEVSYESGINIGIARDRVYPDWQTMIEKEKNLPETDRPDIICIVTPNYLHFEPAYESIMAGFNVICDKPLCMTVEEAKTLHRAVNEQNVAFCITHNYSGYPMVKKAREMISGGELGQIRKVSCEYLQGWLSEKEEEKGNKQAEWRADPLKAGLAGCMADIGTHAFQLTEYITGKKVNSLYSSLNTIVSGRKLDDDGIVITEMEDGIKGTIIASQVAVGEENKLSIKVYGTEGSIFWEQMNPNSLVVKWKNKPLEVYRTATGFDQIGRVADLHSRLPAGHPEGFIESFANLYRNFAININSNKENINQDDMLDYPGIEDGLRGMAFLEAVTQSSRKESWLSLEDILK